VNLLPLLQGGTVQREKPMLWFFYRSSPEIAMRMGDYMLVARANDNLPRTHWISDVDMTFIKNIQPEFFELYNVVEDAGQQRNLATSEPEKLGDMKKDLFLLLEEVKEEGPVWEGLPKYEAGKANRNKQKEFLRNQQLFLQEP
jgi:arylsulfatase A